jgi:hypothetical protein
MLPGPPPTLPHALTLRDQVTQLGSARSRSWSRGHRDQAAWVQSGPRPWARVVAPDQGVPDLVQVPSQGSRSQVPGSQQQSRSRVPGSAPSLPFRLGHGAASQQAGLSQAGPQSSLYQTQYILARRALESNRRHEALRTLTSSSSGGPMPFGNLGPFLFV